MTIPLRIRPGRMSLDELRRVWAGGVTLDLDPAAEPGIAAARAVIDGAVARGDVVYGVTTGFGKLAQTRIAHDRLAALQLNLIRSHAVGVGAPLPPEVVRLVLAMKANSLARGFSGVRPETIRRLLDLANHDLLPVVPAKGSVGASGDLAPLAHLALALIGEGRVWKDGRQVEAGPALVAAGLAPLVLQAKEGISLINGTQVSAATALAACFRAERLLAAATLAGAMSVDGARGSDVPFDARIHAVRGQPGQVRIAALLRDLLSGSAIRTSHVACEKVQDPYSLRCLPQVLGACLDQLTDAARTLAVEANAVSDNPLVFAEAGEVLSGGNFHAEPVAFAADAIANVLAEIGNFSERRTALLVDPAQSNQPAFLVPEPGINSGFMMPQVTAAALASENKILAHPASADSIPTSANQEDHVSMAMHGARRLLDMLDNAGGVVAIELLAAAQAIDLLAPLATSPALAEAVAVVRGISPFMAEDRSLAADIETLREAIFRPGLADRPWSALFGER